ncbi:hypothetical protein [Sporolactobacillus sp. KGMB 08714]|uniref:hypothetical protein n=1 Tax=Sporolactobacillus sp. KGMB 08714 TaxID=3064704 RepID=UPI002FBEF4D5
MMKQESMPFEINADIKKNDDQISSVRFKAIEIRHGRLYVGCFRRGNSAPDAP